MVIEMNELIGGTVYRLAEVQAVVGPRVNRVMWPVQTGDWTPGEDGDPVDIKYMLHAAYTG